MKTFNKRPWILALLGLIFFCPGIAAYFFYTNPAWLGHTMTNKGNLLNPPLLLANLNSQHWSLVLLTKQECKSDCMNQLDELARIRLALGRHVYTVDINLVMTHPETLSKQERLQLKESDIHVIKTGNDFDSEKTAQLSHDGVFISNPQGYLILSYKQPLQASAVFHDLKHLIRNSTGGSPE